MRSRGEGKCSALLAVSQTCDLNAKWYSVNATAHRVAVLLSPAAVHACKPCLHGGDESSLPTSQMPRWNKLTGGTKRTRRLCGPPPPRKLTQEVAVCLSMETESFVKRQKVEHSAATALHTSLSDLDPPHSLAQEFRQAVQDSHAATQSVAVEDEQQGQAAAAVLQRVLQVLESSPGVVLALERLVTVCPYFGVV